MPRLLPTATPASVREQRQSPGGAVLRSVGPSRGVRGDESPRRGLGQRPMRASAAPGLLPTAALASVREQWQSPGGAVGRFVGPSRGGRGGASPRRGVGQRPTRAAAMPRLLPTATPASVREQRQSPGGAARRFVGPSRGGRGGASPRRGVGQRPARASAMPRRLPTATPASVREQRQSPGGAVPRSGGLHEGPGGTRLPGGVWGSAPFLTALYLATRIPREKPMFSQPFSTR
jgi:hypothetical protein